MKNLQDTLDYSELLYAPQPLEADESYELGDYDDASTLDYGLPRGYRYCKFRDVLRDYYSPIYAI